MTYTDFTNDKDCIDPIDRAHDLPQPPLKTPNTWRGSSGMWSLVQGKSFHLHFHVRQQSEQFLPPTPATKLTSHPSHFPGTGIIKQQKHHQREVMQNLKHQVNQETQDWKIRAAEIKLPTNQNKMMNILQRPRWIVQLLLNALWSCDPDCTEKLFGLVYYEDINARVFYSYEDTSTL